MKLISVKCKCTMFILTFSSPTQKSQQLPGRHSTKIHEFKEGLFVLKAYKGPGGVIVVQMDEAISS